MPQTALRALACLVVVLGALVTGAALVGANVASAQADDDDATIDGFDEAAIEVEIRENGSATFTVDYQYRLDGDEADEAWERIREDVREREDEYLAAEGERWQDTLADAVNETEREDMTVSGFAVEMDESSAHHEYGHVTFSFEWGAFATVELNRIEAGDALEEYPLDDNATLLFRWPDVYNATDVQPEPDDRRDAAVLWDGEETTFMEGEPRVDLMEAEEVGDAPNADDGAFPGWIGALAAIALLVIVGAVGWWIGRDGATTDAAAASSQETELQRPPTELLSNEERVLRLLEDHGGRIKQQEVVSELGWTEAKTSQIVGQLRENDEIEVFRIGRENVLALAEEDRVE